MAYPFKTYQFGIPTVKSEIYIATRQEMIFSATICNQGAGIATISLWTKISGIESPIEFEIPVQGTNSADNKAISLALRKIVLQPGDAILAAGGQLSSGNWASTLDTGWASALDAGWASALEGSVGGSASGASQTLTISILY